MHTFGFTRVTFWVEGNELEWKPLKKDNEKLPEEEKLPEKMRDLTVEKTNKSSNKIPGLAAFSSDSTTDDDSVPDLADQRDDLIPDLRPTRRKPE